jgi:hypothetical protein
MEPVMSDPSQHDVEQTIDLTIGLMHRGLKLGDAAELAARTMAQVIVERSQAPSRGAPPRERLLAAERQRYRRELDAKAGKVVPPEPSGGGKPPTLKASLGDRLRIKGLPPLDKG